MQKIKYMRGGILIQVIAYMTIGIIIVSGLVNWSMMSMRVARHTEQREQALAIAEAGIGYYRWHLAHDPADFQDGTGAPGPYVHPFYDKNGVQLGSFSLDITTPVIGSTLVTITSTGTLLVDPSIHRTIQTKVGKPSFAKFAVLSNSDLSIGADIQGPMHSNGFIDMNGGTASNIITSTKTSGTSTTLSNCLGASRCWGVTTFTGSPGASDPRPPTGLTTTTARFTAGRDIGIPAVDFAGVTVDLSQMRTAAQANGVYYPASGSGLGYHIVVKTSDVFDIYTVNTLANGGASCEARQWWNTPSCPIVANNSWSINTQTLLAGNVPFPANGIIFAEDHVWVDGTIQTARITIVAAKLPDGGSPKNIIVNNNLLYTTKDGQDVIGLIAQDNFWVGANSANNLEVDAAIIAQNGRVSRMGYRNCTSGSRANITLYGMFASNQRYAYGNLGSGCSTGFLSGYQTSRTYIYDPYLLYAPPPSFPLTTDQYQILSWDEI